MSESENNGIESIAIIGMVGRFPGAADVDQFWRNLCNGVESVTSFSDEELLAAGVDPAALADPTYVKLGTTLDQADFFDAAFFNYSPREAEIMDPQHRVFLECSHQALEDAGYDPETYDGLIGVYAGATIGSYLSPNVNSAVVASVGRYPVLIGNDKDFVPTRVSYKLNLKGPSINVQTACSTSLVAVHLACQSLLSAECDIALAGGVSIRFPQVGGYFYQEEGILSPDGHCRAFDAKAAGAIGGNGVGIVVLKRLSEAQADGDNIHAVIRATAINNDGSLKVGYTAPGVDGQARVIAAAQSLAGVDPADITYIETHGTGTLLGDPIEISALTQAFSEATDKKQYCAIGSVKANVGHCDAAAGVVGLIKTALCLQQRHLVPSINFEEPNPRIDFANSPFYVNTQLTEWKNGDKPLLAGLSSFGLGGTNAHAIVEEPPVRAESGVSREWQLVSVSAKTESALATITTKLKGYLRDHPETPLADVAFTSHVGRSDYNYRRVALCRSANEAATLLENLDPSRVMTSFVDSVNRPIVFMFPGGGAQYVNMGRDLYASEPVFRQEVDRCAEILLTHLKLDIRDLLYPQANETENASRQLKRTSTALPVLFAIEYATARLWMTWGIQPQAMIGHSLGEYTAACLAGVFSLADALALVTERGRLMDTLPSGSMVSLALPPEEVQAYLTADLSIAALNGPALCVVSGASSAIDSLTERLANDGKEFRRIHIDVASHSATVEPILEDFTRFVAGLELHAPHSPYISNVTGTWITASQATDPLYWASHLRQTVRFADGVSELAREEQRIFLEVGPGQTLCSLVRQHPAKTPAQMVFSSLRHPHDEQSDSQFLLNTLAQLWLVGTRVDWKSFYQDEERHRVRLPTYPFERQRYWVKPDAGQVGSTSSLASVDRRPHIRDWFYATAWQQSVVPRQTTSRLDEGTNWLVFADDYGLSAALLATLRQAAAAESTFTVVETGPQFIKASDDSYAINPINLADYESLLVELQASGRVPDKILHLWAVSDDTEELPLADNSIEERCFFSLLYLAQALGDLNVERQFTIEIISSGLHRISGEASTPEKATLLGPYKVIPQEYPHITTRSIDVVLPASKIWPQELIGQLITEFGRETVDTPIAYRGSDRWLQSFTSVPMDAATDGVPRLRAEGVYLISGGLGGIALELAQFLADEYQAKLILVGRSEFPPKQDWGEWLSTHDDKDLISHKIRRVQRLEQAGAEVLVGSVDVADVEAMRALVETARQRFGKINGVIHAAGLGGGGVIQLKTTEAATSVLRPKVQGTKVLAHLFAGEQLDFFVLCSSLVAFLGGTSHVDYCAANSFLDAFAQSRRGTKDNVVSINWNVWRELGMARNQDLPEDFKEWRSQVHKFGVSPEEGVEMFRRILASELPHVAVSTQDLHALIAQKNVLMSGSAGEDQETAKPAHARPSLTVSYVAPRTEEEMTIAGMWQSLLGIEQVGIHDNFFQLGGHSLLGTRLISRLHDAFHIRIPLRRLFELPTIAGLAEEVGRVKIEDDEAEKRRVLELLESLADDEIEAELSKRL